MTDRQRVLEALREAGSAGLHSMTARRRGLSGNVSQRVRELRDEGYEIDAEPKAWRDATGKRRPGTTYTLRNARGLGAGVAADGCSAAAPIGKDDTEPASVEPAGGSLFDLPEAEAPVGDYRDPDGLEAA